jgi:hypothetical protein
MLWSYEFGDLAWRFGNEPTRYLHATNDLEDRDGLFLGTIQVYVSALYE